MTQTQVLRQTKIYVRRLLASDATGHDWWHIERAVKNAIYIGKWEKADLFIVELAALLHDIDDYKIKRHNSSEPLLAKSWLQKMKLAQPTINHIVQIINNLSFKGALIKTNMPSMEGMAVQDADRLDALGAIGIARAFATGAHLGRPIYDPRLKPKKHRTFAEYKKSPSSSINHFYEKLLLLKDKMNTQSGKKLALRRHRFLKKFLRQFLQEWNGKP